MERALEGQGGLSGGHPVGPSIPQPLCPLERICSLWESQQTGLSWPAPPQTEEQQVGGGGLRSCWVVVTVTPVSPLRS